MLWIKRAMEVLQCDEAHAEYVIDRCCIDFSESEGWEIDREIRQVNNMIKEGIITW